MPTIRTSYEGRRGCGYRKQGGLYLVTLPNAIMRPCGKLPVPLAPCANCGGCGIEPLVAHAKPIKERINSSRGWTWVNPQSIVPVGECVRGDCGTCPLRGDIGPRAGLVWIGEGFYGTPDEWINEAVERGASRRIARIPRGFEVGKTWVFVAHRKVVREMCEECNGNTTGHSGCEACAATGHIRTPGIFHVFCPSAVEYVVRDDDDDETLERLSERGIDLVRVFRIPDDAQMNLENVNA